MADALGMSAVAVRYERHPLEVAAPATTRIADERPVLASCGGRGLDAKGIYAKVAETLRAMEEKPLNKPKITAVR